MLGEVDFRWEHSGMPHSFRPLTAEDLEKHVVRFLDSLPLFSGTKNRRFVAAVHYFYISSRLLVAGHSQWEFMAESVLNLCKALEILFGRTMDDVRNGLNALGYSQEEIEGDYIPLLILRNSLDVAHPRVAILKQKELNTLYMFLFNTEDRFRRLLKCVLDKLKEGEFTLPEDENLRLVEDEQKKMDKLMGQLQKRNPYLTNRASST